MAKGCCEYPYYISLGGGKYRCRKCDIVMVRKDGRLTPEETQDGTT